MFRSNLFEAVARLFSPRSNPAGRTGWGQQNPIDLLADSLAKSPEGWEQRGNAIHRRGVEISWKGSLTAPSATIGVRMDGKKYPVDSSEAQHLKRSVRDLLEKLQARGS